MAEIVTAYCASHAPMQAVDPESAPKHQADSFFAGLEYVRKQAERARTRTCKEVKDNDLSDPKELQQLGANAKYVLRVQNRGL